MYQPAAWNVTHSFWKAIMPFYTEVADCQWFVIVFQTWTVNKEMKCFFVYSRIAFNIYNTVKIFFYMLWKARV